MKAREAREGDQLLVMDCGCGGVTLVLAGYGAEWRCGTCHRRGAPVGRVTLGEGGRIPDDFGRFPRQLARPANTR